MIIMQHIHQFYNIILYESEQDDLRLMIAAAVH